MKTVIIPNDYHPFVIEVNGVKYTYPEGTEQSVPDEVASAIENIYKLAPREGDPNPVPFGVDADGKEEYKSKYTGAEIDAAVAKAGNLPATTSADAGKALVVDEEGKIVAGEVSGGKAFILDLTQDATLFNAFVSLQTAGATALKSLTVPSALHPVVNETFADLISAIDNDITIPIYVICTAGQSRTYAPIIERIGDSGHYRIRFSYYWDNGSDSQYNEYTYVVDIIGFNTENEIVTVKCYTLFSTTGS